MNLLLCEFITGGGMLGDEIPAGLAAEGEMMLQALLGDLAGCEGVKISCTRDARLTPLPGPVITHSVSALGGLLEWLERSVHNYDAVWIIAPESAARLYRLVSLVEQQSVSSLGCSAAAIRLCTDKRLTAERLSIAGIKVVNSLASMQQLEPASQAWVLKPVDGAGSEQTYHCPSRQALLERIESAVAEELLIQPYLNGVVASMSLYCENGKVWVLAVNQQDIEIQNGSFVLKAIRVNALLHEYQRCQLLAEQIVACIEGLKGYFGVDFILTVDGPVVLEINPRLTSSYCGLALSTGLNLAELMINPGSAESLHLDHRLQRDEVLIHL